jgi:hypothetical protein
MVGVRRDKEGSGMLSVFDSSRGYGVVGCLVRGVVNSLFLCGQPSDIEVLWRLFRGWDMWVPWYFEVLVASCSVLIL